MSTSTAQDTGRAASDARRAIEDAVWAPSVHNTQPWLFGVRGTRITLRADPAAGWPSPTRGAGRC